jgi:hypothetical protein
MGSPETCTSKYHGSYLFDAAPVGVVGDDVAFRLPGYLRISGLPCAALFEPSKMDFPSGFQSGQKDQASLKFLKGENRCS